MREIKFRAWTGSEMITPPNDTIGCGSSAEIIEISLAGFVSKRNAYGLDVFGGKNPSFDEPEKDIVLMQFTGLKDKDGNDLYDGDVVTTKRQEVAEIIWHNEFACFCFRTVDDVIKDEIQFSFKPSELKLLGNKYEQKGLLL